MAALYNMLTTIQSFQIGERRFDIISKLPPEIATTIFRMLDPSSMYSGMQVCRTWYNLYRSDRPLRRALRENVRERRRDENGRSIQSSSSRPTNTPSNKKEKAKKKRKSLKRLNTSGVKPMRM